MKTKTMPSPYLTTKEAAKYLRLRPSTLERWRLVGGGPAFRKLGRRVVYSQEELVEFAESGRRVSTSDPGAPRQIVETAVWSGEMGSGAIDGEAERSTEERSVEERSDP